MTAPRDPDAILEMWLEEGPSRIPDVTKRAIVVTTRTTHQSRRPMWVPWRFHVMQSAARIALSGLAVVAVAVGGLYVLGPGSNGTGVGGATTPSPSRPSSAAPSATPATAPTPSPSPSPIDTTAWVPYASTRYGFTISHPANWTTLPADHGWTFAVDATDWLSTGQEALLSPGVTIRVGAWSVPLDPGTTIQDLTAMETWATQYCQKTGTGPCTGIHERAVPLCNEKRDCHPGLLVPFGNDVQALFTGGDFGGRVLVVAVWWGESAAATAPYGGSQRLLEAFLSTMNVWPAP